MLDDLDRAAATNLPATDLWRYWRYKEQLIADGHDEEDMREILTGYLWDATEEPPDEDDT